MRFNVIISAAILYTTHLPTVIAEFDPYADNSGTIVGIAGRDYCILAADTRMPEQYYIRSRNLTRLFQVQENVIFSGSGCWADVLALSRILQQEVKSYSWMNERAISCNSFAHLLSSTLYMRRFFPFYVFSVAGGLDDSGHGAIYRYDAVGSFERVKATCAGKGEKNIQPFLDEYSDMNSDDGLWDQFSGNDKSSGGIEGSIKLLSSQSKHLQAQTSKCFCESLSKEGACEVVVRAFRAAAEREISVGDGVQLWILTTDDVESNAAEESSEDGSKKEILTQDTDIKLKRWTRPRGSVIEKRFYSLPRH